MQPKQGYTSRFMSMLTNTAFQVDSYFQKDIKMNQIAFILGFDCALKENLEEQIEKFIWITYRSDILYKGKLISDQGWGCMMRVAQMLIANTYRRLGYDQVEILFEDNQINNNISPYSIQQILCIAEDYQIQVGSSYKGPQIMTIMSDINKQHQAFSLHNFIEGCIIEDQFDTQVQVPILFVVHMIVNPKVLNGEDIRQLQQYMVLPQFNGCLCGKGNKGYLLLGFQGKNAIYMDPHYVQQSGKATFKGKMKIMALKELSPQMGISFLVKNKQDYIEFKKNITCFPDKLFSIVSITEQENIDQFF
ncbi:Cysteine protease atg4a [Paramecium bursaria]